MGRRPTLDFGDGPRALTAAERQRRYRQRLRERKPVRRYVSIATQPISRPARWALCVETMMEIQDEYRAWQESLPEGLRDSPMGRRLEEVVNLDLSELENIELPLGFGRDED